VVKDSFRTADILTTALHACAAGLRPLEAGVSLLSSNGTFLHRDDFTSRFIQHGTTCGTPMAAIDWTPPSPRSPPAAYPAPAANSESSSSPPASGDTVPGLDNQNTALFITAIRHAAGKRP
jgi:hypothetical protein